MHCPFGAPTPAATALHLRLHHTARWRHPIHPPCSVPSEFVRQSPDAANPPTLFLLLSDMSRRVAAAAQVGEGLLGGRPWGFWGTC